MSTSSLFSCFFRDFDIEIFWCTLELHFFCGIVVYRREVSIVFWHSKCVVLALLIFFFTAVHDWRKVLALSFEIDQKESVCSKEQPDPM